MSLPSPENIEQQAVKSRTKAGIMADTVVGLDAVTSLSRSCSPIQPADSEAILQKRFLCEGGWLLEKCHW